jgi:hypothetical protein
MSKKFALVNNQVVTDVKHLTDEQFQDEVKKNNSVIDIDNVFPEPSVGWVLNGNSFELPQNATDKELLEIALADKKIELGLVLTKFCITRIGARNKILNKTGPQVTTILNGLLPVKFLLETGALGTARFACSQLTLGFTEYADIFQYVINEINSFENSHGL